MPVPLRQRAKVAWYLTKQKVRGVQRFPLVVELEPLFACNLAWAVHIDGLRERHDESVCEEGVFDVAVDAIKEAKRRGFRVTTNSTFFSHDTPKTVREVLDFLNDELKVDAMMISPAYW